MKQKGYKLKNYTSGVAAEKSISEIEGLLVRAGATAVSKFYEDQRLAGFIFQIPYNGIPLTFKLPSNPKAVQRVMMAGIKKKQKGTEKRVADQSERTAWALLRDWVHTQLSMIKMEQAEALQVFLPYSYNGDTDTTLFDKVKSGGFKLLTANASAKTPEKTESK